MATSTLIALPVANVCAQTHNSITNNTNLFGAIGLNTIPSARHDPEGTARFQIATNDPYIHSTLGIQLTPRLWAGLRQTAEISSLRDDAKHLYPGLDLKLRLIEETAHRPEISIGLQSAFGHKQMATEYLALSKRYESFDFTAGMGWGRYGQSNHAKNPLGFINHFSGHRANNGEDPNMPDDWFKGDVGFFTGIEYTTPIKGLSLKADWTSDKYKAEEKSPASWSIAANYKPWQWIDMSIGAIGTNTIMARLSLQNTLAKWPFKKSAINTTDIIAMRPFRTNEISVQKMRSESEKFGHVLSTPIITGNAGATTASAALKLSLHHNTSWQLGQAFRSMANHGGPDIETLTIQPAYYGLRGPFVTVQRRDFEQLDIHHTGSAAEIWRNTTIKSKTTQPIALPIHHHGAVPHEITTILDQQFGLSEEDNGLLYRTNLSLNWRQSLFDHGFYGLSLRGTFFQNLMKLNTYRTISTKPVRSDIDVFAARGISIDRAYYQILRSITPEIHAGLTTGYLEEMYGGTGGEILYRPVGKTWALGMNIFAAAKRDPYSPMALNFARLPEMTGHLTGYYEIPGSNITTYVSAGRYLAGDWGATLGLQNSFTNGSTIKAYATTTTDHDPDIYGDKTSLVTGIQFSMPLGSIRYVPDGSEMRITSMPFGRNTGQALDLPVKLYDETEKLSYRHIANHWPDVK